MIGRTISNYYFSELLGEGGMGTVYKAIDKRLDRTVAIKVLHDQLTNQEEYLTRFRNEAMLSARISHPNVATLFDFQSINGRHFIVMEYVEGQPLDNILESTPRISEASCCRIAIQILEGLTAAHRLGILHRDLKPANIMLSDNGYVKLMDFGIARLENSARITRENSVIGTLEYLSPELVKGKEAEKSDDLYALGVMMHEMLSGKMLYKADSDAALMYQIAHQAPEIQLKDIDKRLVNIIKKLVHRQKDRRYKDTKTVINDLEAINAAGKIVIQQGQPGTLKTKSKLPSRDKIAQWSFPMNAEKFKEAIPKGLLTQKLPFDIDIRIIGVALGLSLLILLGGLFKTEKAPSNIHEDPQQTQVNNKSEDLVSNYSPVNTPGRQRDLVPPPPQLPIETEKLQEKENNSSRSSTPAESKENKSSSRARSEEKHVIKKVEAKEEKQTPTNEENTTKKVDEEEIEQKEPIKQQEAPIQETVVKNETNSSKRYRLSFPDLELSARLLQEVSSETQARGEYIFFETVKAVNYSGNIIAPAGSKVRARVTKVRSRTSGKKAFLALEIQALQSANGSWLELSFPEYSDTDKKGVFFPSGLILNRIKLKSNTIYLNQ